MSSEKYRLKPGLIAAALATTAWVAIPASAQEPVDEAPPEASEPELPETTGRAVSEFAKTLKDLPPEERSEAAKMLRVIAQENLPEAALANRPEQAGQGPLNNPQTEEPVEPVEPVEEEEPVEPGEPVEPEPPETTGTVVSEEAKGLQELPPEEIPAAAQHLRETAQENLPEQALTHRPEQAGQGQLNRPETAGPPTTRPSATTRPQRPSAASRPQRPQRPARPVRPGRPGS